MSLHFHLLTIFNIREDTTDAIELTLRIPQELKKTFAFCPGQYLTFKAIINGQEIRRSYSICSKISNPELKVAIKKITGGIFSNWAHSNLRIRDQIEVMAPNGQFTIDLAPDHYKHYLAFAAGSGITPILSIIQSTLDVELNSKFILIYGNRNSGSIMFLEQLKDLKNQYMNRFQLITIFSQEEQDIPILNGRINESKISHLIQKLAPIDNIDEVFVCGPNDMIDITLTTLQSLGFDSKHIHLERFGETKIAERNQVLETRNAKITIIFDGQKREIDLIDSQLSIFELALQVGIILPYSCKSGVCSTCRCRILEGNVKMEKNFH